MGVLVVFQAYVTGQPEPDYIPVPVMRRFVLTIRKKIFNKRTNYRFLISQLPIVINTKKLNP
jgi:hypothetical protein